MSSAADNKRWTLSGLWAMQKSSDPSLSQPGAALPHKAQSGIAGQIGEHLNYAARRTSSHLSAPLPVKPAIIREASFLTSSEAPSEDTPPAVRALPMSPPAAQTTLSEEKQQASDTVDDQQPAPQPEGAGARATNGSSLPPERGESAGTQFPQAPAAEGTPYLTFRLGKLRWAIPVVFLREALPDVPAITPLPFSPLWLHGVLNLRGEAVGLINLSELLLDPVIAASAARTDAAMPAVVAEHEGVSLALQVQELGEVIFLEESQFRHLSGAQTRSLPTFAVTHLQAAWFSAQSQSPLLLLNLPKLMTSLLEHMTAKETLGDG